MRDPWPLSLRRRMAIPAAVSLLLGVALGWGPGAAPAVGTSPPWERLRYFVGSWSGEGQGEPGTSTVKREYRPILRERFLRSTEHFDLPSTADESQG